MSTQHRCLMIGVGGMARHWINAVWGAHRERMTFAGLVDVNEALLRETGEALGLPAGRLFTDVATAFAQIEADYCCIVTPPQFHRQAVELRAGATCTSCPRSPSPTRGPTAPRSTGQCTRPA
jgi:predicted dehydrogenase